jgi:hypothetical protein
MSKSLTKSSSINCMNAFNFTPVVVLASTILLLSYFHEVSAFTCDSVPCFGTEQSDKIAGTNGDDTIFAKAGHDEVGGSDGNDKI